MQYIVKQLFSYPTSHTDAVKDFMERKLSGVAPTRWNFSSRLVFTVGEYTYHLIKFFLLINDELNNWTDEEVSTALGFLSFSFM